MTRSHRFRSTTLPRVALAAAAFLVAGLSAPPAAAQTAAQVLPPPGEPRVAGPTQNATAPGAADVRQRAERQRAERQRAERERSQERARAQQDRLRAAEAARVEAARVEAASVHRYLSAVAVLQTELDAQQAARQAAERAAAERAEAERIAAERAATRQASGSLPGGFAALRRCESGGDYGAVNSSGTYRGAYQFSRTTWNSIARSSFPHLVGVDPAAAAPGDQDAMAKALYNRSGAGQWPHCGRHL